MKIILGRGYLYEQRTWSRDLTEVKEVQLGKLVKKLGLKALSGTS